MNENIEFQNWRKTSREIYNMIWKLNPIPVIYDPSIVTEYEAYHKRVSPEEFVKVNYFDIYFNGL